MTFSSQNPRERDTIAAIATPAGEGGIGIVRLSGESAIALASCFFESRSGKKLAEQPSFTARLGRVVRAQGESARGRVVDEVLVLVMRAPNTYTREDMVEIQAHGGPVILRSILDLALAAGARLADPGEFTKRAFLSGRLDLLQAEAVLDLIHAKSEMARAFAQSQLAGSLSEKISSFRKTLIDVLAHLEADIDFPEDFTEPDAAARLAVRLEEVERGMRRLVQSAGLGFVAKRGLRAVIWGRPNVGKSSLLNALAQKNRVIVTPHPGTTRDVVEEEVEIRGFPIRLVDTAGIQETADPIEREGVQRSRLAVLAADLILHVLDASAPLSSEDKALLEISSSKRRILVLNKCDLPGHLSERELSLLAPSVKLIPVSCVADGGTELLEKTLGELVGEGLFVQEEPVISSARQKDILDKAALDVRHAAEALRQELSSEFPATDVRLALSGLAELTGEISNEEVLERLFNQFCIGK